MNAESLDIHQQANERLQNTETQQRYVGAAFPEPPAQTSDDGARNKGQPNEAEDVVPVSQLGSTNCSRREKMGE